jgi:RNA polymerase sigma factor (sigma-70 family)
MALSPKRTYNITSVQRCLRLLGLFSQAPDGLSATEVTRLSGLPVSTVHRFLVNLEEAGFLDCGVSGKYHLGIACFSIGQAALGQLDIRRLSLPYLQALNQHTRETIHLTVRQGATAVYVEKLDSPEHLRIFSRIGALVPLYCTAVGKVLLAYMPEAERDEILRQMEPRRLTPNTIASRQELEQHLHRAPTEQEVAAELQVSVHCYREWQVSIRALNQASLEEVESGDGEQNKRGCCLSGDPNELPSALLERSELQRVLAAAISGLPKIHQTVISLYYHQELTSREIAKIVGVHESLISRIRSRAIRQLQSCMAILWPTRGRRLPH